MRDAGVTEAGSGLTSTASSEVPPVSAGAAGFCGSFGIGGAAGRWSPVLHVCVAGASPEAFDVSPTVLLDITPVVEALPPDAVLADVTGSTRYLGRDTAGLAALIRVRAPAVATATARSAWPPTRCRRGCGARRPAQRGPAGR